MNQQSAGGIIIKEGKVVIVHNRQTDTFTFPKGHIQGGEDLETASLREIREETGLSPPDITLVRKLVDYTRRGGSRREPKDIHLFLYRAHSDELKPMDPENTAEWVALDDVVSRLSYEEDKEFFECHRPEYQ